MWSLFALLFESSVILCLQFALMTLHGEEVDARSTSNQSNIKFANSKRMCRDRACPCSPLESIFLTPVAGLASAQAPNYLVLLGHCELRQSTS